MPYIIEEIPWTSQPQSSTPIDLSGKLFDPAKISAIVASGIGTYLKDPLTGKLRTVTSNPARAPSPLGAGINWAAGVNDYVELDADADNVLDTTSCSMLIATVRTAATTNAFVSYGYEAGATNRSIVHLPFTDNNTYWDFGNATAGSGRLSVSMASYLSTGTVNIWGFSAGPRGREIWRNGVLLASDAGAIASRGSTTLGYRIGAAAGAEGAVGAPAHNDALFVLSKEEWSQDSFEELTRNPWQVFAPQQRKTYYDLIGSNLNLSINKVASSNIVDYPIIELNPSFNKLNQASAVRSLTVNNNIITNVSNTSIGNRNLSTLSLLNSNINNPSILVNNLNININFNINLISRSSILSTLLSESMSTLIIGTSGINSLLAITLNNQISIANNSIRNFNQSINNNIGLNIRNNSSINSIQSILNDLRLNNSNNSDIIAALSESGLLQDLFLTTLLSNNSNPSFNLAYYGLLKNLRIKQVVILNSAKSIVTVETIKAIVKLVRSS